MCGISWDHHVQGSVCVHAMVLVCNPHPLPRWMTDHQLELLSPTLVKDMPNTYTYTKKLAEEYLRKEASDLPITVVRPSIVGAAYKEPVDVSCL